ncbi:MAG: hypothetical protein AAF352_02880 [Pseudomonadota bacterium]
MISGHIGSIDAAIALAKTNGARMAVKLPVSAPFHCALMEPARDIMSEALQKTQGRDPRFALYSNIATTKEQDWPTNQKSLIAQICGQVRWRESMQNMISDGHDMFLEIGAGNVLGGLMKRIDRNVACYSIQNTENIKNIIKELSL